MTKYEELRFARWQILLPLLKDKTATEIIREKQYNPSNVYDLIGLFVEKGWITKQKVGRSIQLTFTEKGKAISDKCKSLIDELGK